MNSVYVGASVFFNLKDFHRLIGGNETRKPEGIHQTYIEKTRTGTKWNKQWQGLKL